MKLPERNQTDSQFVANYLLPALVANGFNLTRARFALAQAAKESGNVSDNSVAGKTNNFLAITAGSTWDGDMYRSVSSGLLFRVYPNAIASFQDHRRLIETKYPQVWEADTIAEQARAIAQSPYITEAVGDNRAAYERGILAKYDAQSEYVEKQLAKYGFIAIGGVALLGAGVYLATKGGAPKDTTAAVAKFFNW